MNKTSSRTGRALGAAVLAGGLAAGAANAQETPRMADGHPDLGGIYVGGGIRGLASGNTNLNFEGRGGDFVGFEADGALRRTTGDNVPIYKPEYWDLISENDLWGNWRDPVSTCFSLGVPRRGGPHQIVVVAGQPAVMLIYEAGFNGYQGSYEGHDRFRWIWTDGRDHDPLNVAWESYNGSSVGHWEGDTLIIESIGFSDETWLHKNGFVHGYDMKVTERLTREGNTLTWEATVEDPEYLVQPWVMTPMVRRLNEKANAFIKEGLQCRDLEPYSSFTRSG